MRHGIDDTIVAVSTPIGEGGIGIVRFSGRSALQIADKLFAAKDGQTPSVFKTYTTHYGHVVDKPEAKKHEIVDEVLLTVMRAPKSYTREDIVEINCHGGIQAVKKVLGLVLKRGARLAEPGEFTRRAFLNGRIDLAQAEAVLDTIRAKTESSLKVAMNQLEGGLSEIVNSVRDDIVGIASEIEASIDFPEEGLDVAQRARLIKRAGAALGRLKSIVDTYSGGMVFREGVLAIICGKPNVGKSSLMNLLLNRDRVIVSPVPGTTRDTVEEVINLKGVPVRLVDTAGITESEDLIEKEGIKRSKGYLRLADIALLVFDASTRIDRRDKDIIKLIGAKKKIVILNKTDLGHRTDAGELTRLFKNEKIIEVSVVKRRNIARLEKAILDMIWSGKFSQGESAVVSNARHKELLDRAYGNMLSVVKALEKKVEPELVAIDLKEAVYDMGLVTGKSVSDDILDRVFEQFCIGK